MPKRVPGLPGAWSAQIPSIERKLRSKFKKNRDEKLCPEFQMKEVAKDHDRRKTVTGPSVCRTQTSKLKIVTFVDSVRLTFAFSILFSEQKWHSSWLFHSSLAKKTSSNSKTTVCSPWPSFLLASTLNRFRFQKLQVIVPEDQEHFMGHQADMNWLDLIVAEEKTLGENFAPKSPTHVSRFGKTAAELSLSLRKNCFFFHLMNVNHSKT